MQKVRGEGGKNEQEAEQLNERKEHLLNRQQTMKHAPKRTNSRTA